MSNLLKGRINGISEVHWLKTYSPYIPWASAHCGRWEGSVEIVRDSEYVTCRTCTALDPLKLETVEEDGSEE